MKNLILIGYRGTGKTTLARLLGERLGVPVVDCDPEIERRAGKSIADIFAGEGENAFRDMEEKFLAGLLEDENSGPFVLATGGGAVLRPETRRRLKNGGHVVWLTASPEIILRRMQGDANSPSMRPNLTTLPPLEEILAMLERRRDLYAETAHTVLDTDAPSLEEIVDEIVALLGERPDRSQAVDIRDLIK